ncbi:MAG: YgiQ family radical SAM protein [Nitrospinae bacterium]|nr:YgiQ family radical SAM protein [Nitrospinota bacterium]
MDGQFLPTSLKEANARGWDRLDVILVTGDAYVDHPSFGAAVVGRYLESLGLKVGVIPAPDPARPDDFKKLGEPALFFGVTSGNLDSMMMRQTALKKPRSDDAYAEGGMAGLRPPRAVIAYCNKIRQAFANAKIVIGGLEASLRRFAHYDYWDDRPRRSVLQDSKADILVYGMAESPLKEIVEAMRAGAGIKDIKDIRGTAVMISAEERKELGEGAVTIPAFEEVNEDKSKYARAAKMIHLNQNPGCAQTLAQKHGARYVKVNPPALPLSTDELDAVYALPFMRAPHPCHKKPIPAFEMIRFSVTAMRGCFGGCSFCALTVHQGRAIQSRSEGSIVAEVEKMTHMKGFTGYVSDIGGPTANMYRLRCREPEVERVCKRISCVHPDVCKRLGLDHGPQIEMLRKARSVKGVKKVFVSSGVRYDLANLSPEYIKELAGHHVSGQLKVAPEHCDPDALALMRKPSIETFDRFKSRFMDESAKARLEQYIIPYFISAHPGCGLSEAVEMALYLKKNGIRPRQVQDFIPAPMTLAADMYYTGTDPMTGREVKVAKGGRERALQRALMQYFKPENADAVREALRAAGREDLIGHGHGKLIGYGSPGGAGRKVSKTGKGWKGRK